MAKKLIENDVKIISTGGTGKFLKQEDIAFTSIENVTGNPEAFGGRMKTLSFQIMSALLFKRGDEEDEKQAKELGIFPIDLVVCNLYPFFGAMKNQLSSNEQIELIDIGGPSMLRAAAKNFNFVTTLSSPSQYQFFLDEYEKFQGPSLDTRKRLASEVFFQTACYDLSISLSFVRTGSIASSLRYGENPHQKALIRPLANLTGHGGLCEIEILSGKPMSYNNYLDLDATWKNLSELHQWSKQKKFIAVIFKHGNPCGVSVCEDSLVKAMQEAWEGDPVSAFGSIVGFNSEVDRSCAEFLNKYFVEIVIAPSFCDEALEILAKKKNIRLIKVSLRPQDSQEWTIRSVAGKVLFQEEDESISLQDNWTSVTKKTFSKGQKELGEFGLIMIKYLKSNSLCLVKKNHNSFVVISSGVGQPNRLDCLTKLILKKNQDKNNYQDAILISEAFFPFYDIIETCHKEGIHFILQPGGSIKDKEVISKADELGIGMMLTHRRHFRH